MGLDAAKVYAPTPDQSTTTGAVSIGTSSAAAPTDARTALGTGWTSGGYVSEDGVSLTVNRSVTPIRDWSKNAVRNLLTEYSGSLSLSFLQVDEFALQRMFGSTNITKTANSSSHGEQLKAGIGAELPPIEKWCLSMKDGDARVRIYIPRGQMTEVSQIDFKPDAGHTVGGTLSTYDDGTGHSIYVMYDDGVMSA